MMRIKQITLHNYRNYVQLDLQFNHNLNIFIGENAQGKTNIIEAIYYAAMGHSHRNNSDQELIKWNENSAVIKIDFARFGIDNQLKFTFSDAKAKEIVYNCHPIKQKDLVGVINVVLFSPEDLFLIKGAPAGRRRFIDIELSQANPVYYRQLLKYNRIVSQRNMLLKKIRERKANRELLDSWDIQLAEIAASIVSKRMDAVKKLNMLANLMHRKISHQRESLEIIYEINGMDKVISEDLISWYNNKLSDCRENDVMRGSTGIGPHRDDLILKVNQINLRSFGSQGQQRTGVLALKLAELEFIKSETGEYPVLLLDDVMSELDVVRREQLLLFIKERIQTFITATDSAYFPKENFGKYYHVIDGKVVE